MRTSAPSQSLQDQGWWDKGTQQRAAKGCGKERGGDVYLIKEGKALGLGPLVSNIYSLLAQLEEAIPGQGQHISAGSFLLSAPEPSLLQRGLCQGQTTGKTCDVVTSGLQPQR